MLALNLAADGFQGCVLGLALGDAMGAPFEGGPLERLLWRLIGRTMSGEMRWTDDTQMSLDVIESLLAIGSIDQSDLASRFAAGYRWSRGYGRGTTKVLKRIARGADWRQAASSAFKNGSYGNGAAMRAPIVGLYCAGHLDRLDECTRRSAVVTHTHPLAIEGAVIIARATAAVVLGHPTCDVLSEASTCCVSDEFRSRLARAVEWLASKRDVERTEVRRSLGAGTAAHESCVTAVYLALRFRDGEFVDLQRFAAAMGGDVDTIGAMAGAIWGAANGVKRLPAELLDRLEQHEELATLAARLHQSANA